ncbi:MAG: preprotein translocase subunit YajC [Bacteroidota bacterium]
MLNLLMTGGATSGWGQFIPLILIVVVFYFFMIRPQVKKQKEAKKFMENIKKGDKVVTIGGIHGKIHEVQEGAFIVEIADGVRVKVLKTALSMDGSVALNQNQN